MYGKQSKQLGFDEFYTPFGGYINNSNRWVQMSRLLPWEQLEADYANQFNAKKGAPSKPFRMALGALLIKHMLGVSDREVVELIAENHYMQYFIGLDAYRDAPPFDPSLLVHFRRRLGEDVVRAAMRILHKKHRSHQ